MLCGAAAVIAFATECSSHPPYNICTASVLQAHRYRCSPTCTATVLQSHPLPVVTVQLAALRAKAPGCPSSAQHGSAHATAHSNQPTIDPDSCTHRVESMNSIKKVQQVARTCAQQYHQTQSTDHSQKHQGGTLAITRPAHPEGLNRC
jgi:hypothetical protein